LKLIENNVKKPLKVFMQVSENDLGANDISNPARNWVVANKLMSVALNNKGYASRFVISRDSGHCDDKVFNYTIVQALNWIWKD
jgi:iron(III)-enterobactin esterase